LVGVQTVNWDSPLAMAKALKAAGYKFVIGYITPNSHKYPHKQVNKAVVAACNKAGLPLMLFYETYATRAWSGYSGGVRDAWACKRYLSAAGLPRNSKVIFTADCSIPGKYAARYWAGIKSVFGFAQWAYGGGCLTYLFDHKLIAGAVQTAPLSFRLRGGGIFWDPRSVIREGYACWAGYHRCTIERALTTDWSRLPVVNPWVLIPPTTTTTTLPPTTLLGPTTTESTTTTTTTEAVLETSTTLELQP
jgi:hypothetical protein